MRGEDYYSFKDGVSIMTIDAVTMELRGNKYFDLILNLFAFYFEHSNFLNERMWIDFKY